MTTQTTPKTYDVRTHGCQMNVHDSERLAGLLETAGLGRAPRDLREMTEAVEAYLSDEAARAASGAHCTEYAYANHAPTAVARRYIELGAVPARSSA